MVVIDPFKSIFLLIDIAWGSFVGLVLMTILWRQWASNSPKNYLNNLFPNDLANPS